MMITNAWAHKTSLTRLLFIVVPVPSQESERLCTCVYVCYVHVYIMYICVLCTCVYVCYVHVCIMYVCVCMLCTCVYVCYVCYVHVCMYVMYMCVRGISFASVSTIF
jgi:hypothetical protein